MASNSKALIIVPFCLFLLSTQPIVLSTARKILGANEFGSNDKKYAARKLEGEYSPDLPPYYPSVPIGGLPDPSTLP
ncbi:unnamed protein product [Coffea canephora]|uniref:Uncharacterized protein n=1 Tax=Coffea canephora TaxID=49390 RepID=A0A068UBI5_COFCA|nr:unnamed protein product [Coffea canephora]